MAMFWTLFVAALVWLIAGIITETCGYGEFDW